MKCLLLPLAFVSGIALACPGDAGKSAAAPVSDKTVAAAKVAPTSTPAATAAVTKGVIKVATKPAAEARKSAPL